MLEKSSSIQNRNFSLPDLFFSTLINSNIWFLIEIYRIVSQKQLRDPSEEEATIRPNNVETINVKPTVNTESVRKQCCNS